MSPARGNALARSRASFGLRLRRFRMKAGMSQSDLERRSGIQKSRISRYENDHLLPSMKGLKRLADSLDIPEHLLLGDADPYDAFADALRRAGVPIASAREAEELAGTVAETLRRGEGRPALKPAAGRR